MREALRILVEIIVVEVSEICNARFTWQVLTSLVQASLVGYELEKIRKPDIFLW